MMTLTPIFAEAVPISATEAWILGCTIIGAITGIGALVVAIIAVRKKVDVQVTPQPLAVQMVQELHERFANKEDFEKHCQTNTSRHAQLFSAIDRVEEGARLMLDKRMAALNTERAKTLDHLNKELGFIRESIVAMQTEMKIRNEKKS